MISSTELLPVTNKSRVNIQLASALHLASEASNKYLLSQIIFCGYVSKYCGLSNNRVVFLRHYVNSYQKRSHT